MSNGEILNFIENARRNKVPDEQTKERLESLGWEGKDIDEALHLTPKTPEPAPTPGFRTAAPQYQTVCRESSHLTLFFFILVLLVIAFGFWKGYISTDFVFTFMDSKITPQ